MKQYVLRNMIAVDQLINTILGGMPDETISARAYRKSKSSRTYKYLHIVIDIIFFFDPDHCRTSFESEFKKNHLPKEYK